MSEIKTNETQSAELKSDELEQVTGGTVTEYEQLVSAITSNNNIRGGDHCIHVPIANLIDSSCVEDFLDKYFGIKADISLGVLGTGAFSSHNTYTDKATGRSLTHQEVIDIIESYG